ncbi:axin interactor, dorsalization-associated protein isoform X4 [Puntigrus tetrazona]|uniref:axin interactor, dorsalization-associated protein isoform X4 n=1 Tax=Puntigrus tetrazona TaxID=1606681 RepID=UPI001C8904BD|nr:axin interactor, dorsalization-associated protein isoform X4 [Puntigrus tetrazona]
MFSSDSQGNFRKRCSRQTRTISPRSRRKPWESSQHALKCEVQPYSYQERSHLQQRLPFRRPASAFEILAPGEEENLELEEELDAGTGAGLTPSFSSRVPGTLLPRLPSEPEMTLLTLTIEKIGLKDAGQCIDPYITVSVKDLNGIDLNPVQDTPVATRKEDTYIHFSVDVEIQKHLEKLPKGAAIFFEFKHYKPKKRFTSTKCFAFMEMDEIKPGPIVIELYKKPTDFKRKKLNLLTKKPLYLHLNQTLHKD